MVGKWLVVAVLLVVACGEQGLSAPDAGSSGYRVDSAPLPIGAATVSAANNSHGYYALVANGDLYHQAAASAPWRRLGYLGDGRLVSGGDDILYVDPVNGYQVVGDDITAVDLAERWKDIEAHGSGLSCGRRGNELLWFKDGACRAIATATYDDISSWSHVYTASGTFALCYSLSQTGICEVSLDGAPVLRHALPLLSFSGKLDANPEGTSFVVRDRVSRIIDADGSMIPLPPLEVNLRRLRLRGTTVVGCIEAMCYGWSVGADGWVVSDVGELMVGRDGLFAVSHNGVVSVDYDPSGSISVLPHQPLEVSITPVTGHATERRIWLQSKIGNVFSYDMVDEQWHTHGSARLFGAAASVYLARETRVERWDNGHQVDAFNTVTAPPSRGVVASAVFRDGQRDFWVAVAMLTILGGDGDGHARRLTLTEGVHSYGTSGAQTANLGLPVFETWTGRDYYQPIEIFGAAVGAPLLQMDGALYENVGDVWREIPAAEGRILGAILIDGEPALVLADEDGRRTLVRRNASAWTEGTAILGAAGSVTGHVSIQHIDGTLAARTRGGETYELMQPAVASLWSGYDSVQWTTEDTLYWAQMTDM